MYPHVKLSKPYSALNPGLHPLSRCSSFSLHFIILWHFLILSLSAGGGTRRFGGGKPRLRLSGAVDTVGNPEGKHPVRKAYGPKKVQRAGDVAFTHIVIFGISLSSCRK